MSLRRGLGFSQSRPGSLSLQMLHVIHSTRCDLRDIAAANHSQLLQLSRLEVDLQRGLQGPPRTLMRFWTEPLKRGAARLLGAAGRVLQLGKASFLRAKRRRLQRIGPSEAASAGVERHPTE